jgi:hypothetical protein
MSHQAKVDTGLGVAPGMSNAAAMSHQAKVDTGKGRPPPEGSSAWKQHQANLRGPNLAQHQALVQHWLQAEVQGWSGKPGDKPSIAGAHWLYEQHMQTTNSKPLSNSAFSGIARELLHQPQHQELASHFRFDLKVWPQQDPGIAQETVHYGSPAAAAAWQPTFS